MAISFQIVATPSHNLSAFKKNSAKSVKIYRLNVERLLSAYNLFLNSVSNKGIRFVVGKNALNVFLFVHSFDVDKVNELDDDIPLGPVGPIIPVDPRSPVNPV